ncbi:MAG: polysaccharide biosynthesis protein [Dysgonamonadaceae bacterium]|jgi:FlaA1/EpsC-like NDP-sugar epimerase|nr:polysaccharide biosynthesis protein [Dysgonamonadaceae bacterium]
MSVLPIEQLLNRPPIRINSESIHQNLCGKCILITGAAGSIGSEIARQVSPFAPRLLLLCDIAESPLYTLQLELQERFPELSFRPIICSIRNKTGMEKIFQSFRPDYVYHTAAYKHVPLMEEHPSECVLTNVKGTQIVADLASTYHSDAFVLISTDKAINPANIMGASKRIAEIYVNYLNFSDKGHSENSKTRFIITRFGNVLGSNGSVIQRFQEQIERGGPVTVTHPEMSRYFMSIPEACRLVLEAGNMGSGGEIFIFNMGDPITIVSLAEKMIHLAGYEPYKDIDIVFTGLRPGEKLTEEILTLGKETTPTLHNQILIEKGSEFDYRHFYSDFEHLLTAATRFNETEVVQWMKRLVPEFISRNSVFEELDLH